MAEAIRCGECGQELDSWTQKHDYDACLRYKGRTAPDYRAICASLMVALEQVADVGDLAAVTVADAALANARKALNAS